MLTIRCIYLCLLIGTTLLYLYIAHHNKYNETGVLENFEITGPTNLNRINIWKYVKSNYGENVAASIMPKTYVFPEEIKLLLQDKHNEFILKTYRGNGKIIGQRSGVKLFDNKQDIIKEYNKYVIGQVFIPNPYLINNHKFDIRFFLVVYCGIGSFLYLPGYCVYSFKPFQYHGLDREAKINQVHTNESHYDQNNLPRTFFDMCKLLPNKSVELVISKLTRNLSIIVDSVPELCDATNQDYHIFGVDIELTDKLEPLVIEINQTPSLSFNVPWKSNITRKMLRDISSKRFASPLWVRL
jgi:glutathione synthase/RimK-type ligase-like ATP-grasp enzyme